MRTERRAFCRASVRRLGGRGGRVSGGLGGKSADYARYPFQA